MERNIVKDHRVQLKQLLSERFEEEELRTLSFNMDIDYDNLPGRGKAAKARELVVYLERRDRLSLLVETGKKLRPDITWPDDPDATHTYLKSLIREYETLERIYIDLPISTTKSQVPLEFFPTPEDISSFQILLERSFGREYPIIERVRVAHIQEVIESYPRFVLLGDPGCGKSVTVLRLALDYAREAIQKPEHPLPVVIELGEYDTSQTLYEWILQQGTMVPDFQERLSSGTLLLLLDGLNEMPRSRHSENIDQLREFIDDYHRCQLVLTCRRLDYDESLGLQQVEIEPLDRAGIKQFIAEYIGDTKSEHLYDILRSKLNLLELASNAFNLKLIIALYAVRNQFPRNRSKLIDGLVGALYEREKRKSGTPPVTEEEIRMALGKMAFAIQAEIGKGTSVEKDWGLQSLESSHPTVDSQAIVDLAVNMGLVKDARSSLRFQHQLIQEYFAGQELEKHLTDPVYRKRFWVPETSNPDPQNGRIIEDRLPSPPTTGWEEATIMLAGSKTDASELIAQVLELNAILAARCIEEGQSSANRKVYRDVVGQLRNLIEDPSAQLSNRIQAGFLLGELEDPRFKKLSSDRGFALLPPMIEIPGGDYLIGSDKSEVSDSYHDETPLHTVSIQEFLIGKFPVTNAEFACFIDAGGYHQPEYWTDQGWAWRKGEFDESLEQWILNGYRNVRDQVLQEEDRLEPGRAEDSEEMDLWWKILMKWPQERVERELNKLFEERNRRLHNTPCYWDDPAFNARTQPVIVSWFEAQAYCCWLSKVTNKHYRLPTEAEWEAAAGGGDQIHPWGDEADISRYNILPSRILRTAPIGVYPTGESQFGVSDLLGNVWEWTSSAKFPYPYRDDDGRESPFLQDSRRAVRGGSWAVSKSSARNSCRGNFPPDNMVRNYIGFRVAKSAE
jgi:formylglycine-generating enzyme required for sulfatase activity